VNVELPDTVKVHVIEGRDTLTLVRPDGYIGLVARPSDVQAVRDHLGDLPAACG
jgi:hypothetical protein